jgi:phosphohistidine phosphatase SixA/8-oxo-dGTP pyrophosphatase MutT (NUDIX family)
MSVPMSMSVNGGSRIKAAGAVLWRPGDPGPAGAAAAGPRVALIHRDRYDDWSFPKGKADSGEHALLTAVREVEEETGVRAVLGRRLPNTEYEVLGRDKRVKYWSGRATGFAEGGEEIAFTPNDEVDALVWVSGEEARRRLSNPLDLRVLDAFLAAPADTFPIVLQRHGKAERRGGSFPDDLARPLAPAGLQQAIALSQLLAVYGAEELISSPAVRCVSTVQPYAELNGVKLTTDSALTEIAYVHAPRGVVSWLADLAKRLTGAIVCTHGPVLDELIGAVLYGPGFATVAGTRGPWLGGEPWSSRIADRWTSESLSTGCAWVLHFDTAGEAGSSPRLVAVDRLKP